MSMPIWEKRLHHYLSVGPVWVITAPSGPYRWSLPRTMITASAGPYRLVIVSYNDNNMDKKNHIFWLKYRRKIGYWPASKRFLQQIIGWRKKWRENR